VLINGQHRFSLLCIHIANKKFTNVFVRASAKLHIPASHVHKSGCRLENCHAYICVACVSIPNRICLMLYGAINFNDITSAFGSYQYERNITFAGV